MTARYLTTKLAANWKPETRIDRFLKSLLSFINANPSYDAKMHLVRSWMIEFEDGRHPGREIALDQQGTPIMWGPGPGAYGFWLDTNMTYGDFEGASLSKEEFEEHWKLAQRIVPQEGPNHSLEPMRAKGPHGSS